MWFIDLKGNGIKKVQGLSTRRNKGYLWKGRSSFKCESGHWKDSYIGDRLIAKYNDTYKNGLIEFTHLHGNLNNYLKFLTFA